eukprot:sb/3465942/
MATPDLINARNELKQLIWRLYTRLDQLGDAEDEFQIDPEQNIADNFICKRRMRCEKCKIQFQSWSDFDTHQAESHDKRLECQECELDCKSLVDKANHDLLEHPVSAANNTPLSTSKYADGIICCSLCRRHFSDIQGWQRHYQDTHATKTGAMLFDWMVEKCDNKGSTCPDKKLLCLLCQTEIPFIADVFNFFVAHGQSPKHKKLVAEHYKNHGTLPDKFLKGLRSGNLYHPHQIQSSCCCKTPNCEYCPIHKSCLTKFNRNSHVTCKFCDVSFLWTSYKSALEHMASPVHCQMLDRYILAHGITIQFHWLFKPKTVFKETPTSKPKGGGPAAKISANLFLADEIFEIFGKIWLLRLRFLSFLC